MSKLPVALVSASLAAALGFAPAAVAAKTDPQQAAVFLGGTGTGMIPAGPVAPSQFITPWVTGPYKGLNMIYNGAPWATPQSSVAELNTWIDSQRAQGYGPVTVVGLSKGAQVAQASMHAPNAPVGVKYVLIGNPDRDGGLNTALGFRPAYGEVKSNVHDVYAEYDGFAEVPSLLNPLAVLNAGMGIVYVHPFYGQGGVTDPLTRLDQGVTTVKDNLDANGKPNGTTTTSTRIPTPYLPLTKPVRDFLGFIGQGTQGLDQFDAAIRPIIDAGYAKPVAGLAAAPKAPEAPKPVVKEAPKAAPVSAVKNETPAKADKPAEAPKPTRQERREAKKAERTERQAAKNAQREERREARKAAKAEKAATGDTAHQTKADKPAKEHTTTKKESNDNG